MAHPLPRDRRGRFVSRRRRSNRVALLVAQIGTAAGLTVIAVAVPYALGGLILGML